MELLLNIDELSDITNSSWDDSFHADEEKQIKDMLQMEGIQKLARVNKGPCADLLTFLVVINAIADTYLVASKLLEGNYALKKLFSKIKGFISRKIITNI